MTRATLAPLAVLAVVNAGAVGFLAAGPTSAALAPALLGLAAILVALAVGWGYGRLASRDPLTSWTISPVAAQIQMGVLLAILAMAAFQVGVVVACPLAAGYLRARGGRHASDTMFFGAAAITGLAVVLHASDWGRSAAWLLPCIMVALALAAREAWDLLDARADARARALPRLDGARPAESDAERTEVARAALVLAGSVAAAALAGLARPSLRPLSGLLTPGLAAVVLVACLWGVVRLLRARPSRA